MKTHLEKELEHVYLVFDSAQIREHEYAVQMVLRCSPPSVLPLSITLRDGKSRLRADVTACTSLSSRFQSVSLTGEHVRSVLRAVRDLAVRLPAYLLDPRDICLDPEVIFFGPEHDEVLLCYVPHLADDDPDTVRLLADFFLKKIDHSDAVASHLAYGLFDQVAGNSYMLGDVISRLLDSSVGASERSTAPDPGQYSDSYDTGQPVLSEATSRRAILSDAASKRPVLSDAVSRRPVLSEASAGRQPSCKTDPYPRGRSLSSPDAHRARSRGSQSRKRHNASAPAKKHADPRRLLPAFIICGGAVIIILLFGLDMSQAIGMGFLCAALIWMVHNAVERHSSDVRNIWADESDSGDDDFYNSLLREVYAEDNEHNEDRRNMAPEPPPVPDNSHPALLSLQRDVCPDIVITSPHLLLGKSARSADAVLPDQAVSRTHARIEQRTDGYYVTDLYSTNGTSLDGKRLNPGQAYPLRDGALLGLASLRYKVSIPRAQR